MTYEEYLKITALVKEREELIKGLCLVREMVMKSSSLENQKVKLVFTETQHQIDYPGPEYQQPLKETKKGTVVLDEVIFYKVAVPMADHWQARIREINLELKALGIDP